MLSYKLVKPSDTNLVCLVSLTLATIPAYRQRLLARRSRFVGRILPRGKPLLRSSTITTWRWWMTPGLILSESQPKAGSREIASNQEIIPNISPNLFAASREGCKKSVQLNSLRIKELDLFRAEVNSSVIVESRTESFLLLVNGSCCFTSLQNPAGN